MNNTFNRIWRLSLVVISMLMGTSLASAQNSIPCTAEEFNFSAYTSIDGKIEGGYNGLGSFKNGYTVTYVLNNTVQQAYTIKFAYKGGHSATTVEFTFTDQDYNEVKASKTVEVVSDWAYTEVDVPELPAGDITMVMKFTIPSGVWCCNMKEMSFSAQSSEKYVELPTTAFDLQRYTENQTELAEEKRSSTTLESFKNGSYVTYLLNNTIEKKYIIAFEGGTPRDDASIDVIITNKETGEEFVSQSVNVENTGDWNITKLYLVELPQMAVDKYVLKLVFKSSGGNWTANLKNLRFVDETTLTAVADGAIITLGSPWSTSGQIKCANIIDSSRNGAKAVFLAKNTDTETAFDLVAKAATPNEGVQLKVSALTLGGDTLSTKTLDVVQGADWNTTQDLIYELGKLPSGCFFVVLDIIKNDGSWAVNIHEMSFEINEVPTGIVSAIKDSNSTFDVYDLKGHAVARKVTSLKALPQGVYVVKGKVIVK